MAALAQKVSSEVIRGYLQTSIPTIVDVLDSQYGLLKAMSHEIKPLIKKRIAGRAVTLLWAPGADPAGSLDPFFAAVDACSDGSVLVGTNGGNKTISCMGDLVAAALQARGAVGAVMDGAVRDIAPIIEMDFPVFAASVSPVNPTGRASVTFNVPIVCGGVAVNSGDVVVADWDGVVVVPQAIAAEVLAKSVALEKLEAGIRDRIREVVRTTKLGDIFAEFEHAD
jgi:4-hydroxy-4-methyl-2-oxoglutarate aldolase